MDRQARTGDRGVLVKGREMTGRTQKLPLVEGGRRGKDDRKQNELAPLRYMHTKEQEKRPLFLLSFGPARQSLYL
jgi:hypothetical protein